MSNEQLLGLLARLKEDAELREKLRCARDLNALVAIANAAGFMISKTDWLDAQQSQFLDLSDQELEMAGGTSQQNTCAWVQECTVHTCAMANFPEGCAHDGKIVMR